MWYKAGRFILKNRLSLLIILFAATAFMGWKASHVQLSYDFTRALPTNNPKYQEYQSFLKKFGADGSTMVIGINSADFYSTHFFNEVGLLNQQLKKIPGVTEILSVPEVVTLKNDSIAHKLLPQRIFHYPYASQDSLNTDRRAFENLPFYRRILYNPATHSYIVAVTVNKDTIGSKSRTRLINDILKEVSVFEKRANTTVHNSGLPFIRTSIGNRIKAEMSLFLIGSLVLLVITLLLFFRSVSATLMSLLVVCMGVVWSLGTIVLLGYKITLLTALIPPLIVVIGIPNCIYFLNKYHTAYRDENAKEKALVTMVGRMGIVTLFCNIAAAIGFRGIRFNKE
jgi:predicted RND superfamily exporter protein